MIELKIFELVAALPSIEKLRDAQGLKVSTIYKIKGIVTEVRVKHQNYDESRIALIKSLGTVKVGDQEKILPEKEQEFHTQMAELVNTVEKLDCDPVPLQAIENAEGLTVRDIELLEKFIQA